MWHRLTQALLSFIVFAAGAALAQDPYLRPPLAEREATANAAGIIPQPFLAMAAAIYRDAPRQADRTRLPSTPPTWHISSDVEPEKKSL